VHLIRNSVKFVGYKERKVICADLKNIYKSSTVEEAETALDSFSEKWDKKYPNISQM
jgi:putative transposase